MPDHIHLILLGISDRSDQVPAVSFIRRHLTLHIAPAQWQSQAHDHVLTDEERQRNTFPRVAAYILENPVRKNLVQCPDDYPFRGCCLPGYPEFDLKMPEYWERFWRCYNYLIAQAEEAER